MGLFDKLKRKKGKDTAEPDTVRIEESPMDEEEAYLRGEEDIVAAETPVEITYGGGILSPTQRSKEEQYSQILADLENNPLRSMEDTLDIIDRALREGDMIYDVLQRIEEQDIPLLALVALELASEEDISAYQLHKERSLGISTQDAAASSNADLVLQPAVKETQQEEPTAGFQFAAGGLSPIYPSEDVIATQEPAVMPIHDDPWAREVPSPVTEGFDQVEQELAQAYVFDTAQLPASASELPDVASLFTTQSRELVEPSEERVVEESFEMVNPAATENPVFAQLFGATPRTQEEQVPAITSWSDIGTQNNDTQEDAPVVNTTQVPEETKEPVGGLQPSGIFSDLFKPKGSSTSSIEILQGENPPHQIQEEPQAVAVPQEVVVPTASDEALRKLLSIAEKLEEQAEALPPAQAPVSPTLSEEERADKIGRIKSYRRAQAPAIKTVYVVCEGADLPAVQGYSLVGVTGLDDLHNFGLNSNDLLVMTAQVPVQCAEDFKLYVGNLQTDRKPYRIVTLPENRYTEVEITGELSALTAEVLDTYYSENPIERDNRNQLGGFHGLADFIENH